MRDQWRDPRFDEGSLADGGEREADSFEQIPGNQPILHDLPPIDHSDVAPLTDEDDIEGG